MVKPQITDEDFDKVSMILPGRSFFSFRQLIGNKPEKSCYQNQSSRYLSQSNGIPEIHFSSLLSNQTVNNKNSIPSKMLKINALKLNKSLGNAMLVPTNGTANQAAEILMDNPENALSHGRNFFLAI